jgi:hypothetical protein
MRMKVIFIAGSYGSGTSALTGMLDGMGITSLPPHLTTEDPRTPNSFESMAFRSVVKSFANESTMSVDMSRAGLFVQRLRNLLKNADVGPASAAVLKMPLASICLPQIIEAVDPYIILVHRPMEEIEASRIRRNWEPQYGAIGAQMIYPKLYTDLSTMKKTYLAISYHDLQENARRELLRITNFCGLQELDDRVDGVTWFVRERSEASRVEDAASPSPPN